MTAPVPAPTPVVKPAARVLRTFYMVLTAVAVAIPAATAAFGFTAETSAKLVGFAGGITIIVTALWNALEGAGVIGTAHGTAPAQPLDVRPATLGAAGPPDTFGAALTDAELERLAATVADHVIMRFDNRPPQPGPAAPPAGKPPKAPAKKASRTR